MKKKAYYIGKTVFVGIDVHKKTYSVVAVCDGEQVKRDSITAKPDQLVKYLKKYFGDAQIKSAYEAGFSGFHLHRYLLKNSIENIVVHAAAIEVSSRDKVKTDRRDALKIATQLAVGRLKGINVPDTELEDRRELSRLREHLIKERKRIASKLKHKANYFGFIDADDTKVVSCSWIEKILTNPMGPETRYHIETLSSQWHTMHKTICEVDKRFKDQARADEAHEKIYRSVKGIGPTAARILSNELGDMSQFSSERDLFSYVGLTPSEYSSGEHRRQGHITRQGKPVLRRILVQCSWIAIKYDKSLKEVYDRLMHRRGAKRAIIGVARRLIGRIRACFRQEVAYSIKAD